MKLTITLEQIEEQLFKLNDLWQAVKTAQRKNDSWQAVKTAQREADEAERKWEKMMRDYYGPRYKQRMCEYYRSESDGTDDEGTEVETCTATE